MRRGRPLAGRRVLVTRGEDKADLLPRLLEEAGATVVKVPVIAAVALVGHAEIRDAVDRLRAGEGVSPRWLVLTSETAVRMLVAAGAASLEGVAVAAVGPATAAALRAGGVEVELVAPGQEAESLADELNRRGVGGSRALVLAAAGGRNVVAPALQAGGARVEVIEAYRTVMPEAAPGRLRAAFEERVDAVTFTSGSTVRNFAEAVPELPRGCTALCIGPLTAAAARAAGWTSIITAAEHSAAGLVAVLVESLGTSQPLP